MDPFTQRMLERARARREKLDTQLSNAGHDLKKRRSPLKDANAILAQAPAIESQITSNSPVKVASPIKQSLAKSLQKSPQKQLQEQPPAKSTDQENMVNKENGETPVSNIRSKLQRLGNLYSEDSSRELSSPIHRTEERFAAEDEPSMQTNDSKSSKSSARLDRLAALASTINNWEDDLSHPTLVKQTESKAIKVQAKLNEQVRRAAEPQPSTSGNGKWISNDRTQSKAHFVGGTRASNSSSPGQSKDASLTKQLKWDKAVLENLEKNPNSNIGRHLTRDQVVEEEKTQSPSSASSGKDNGIRINTKAKDSALVSKTPEKKNVGASTTNVRMPTRFGCGGSPKSPIQSPGSVLSKASMFEAKNIEVKAKDPAEMTLSERMALFERNKGEAPLIPKAPLTMSVPSKKLIEKEKTNSSPVHGTETCSANGRGKVDLSNKKVVSQRAIFEQGSYTQELENDILRNTHNERQRELEMLRSRFNRNKQMAQAAAGSCIRTSESSEGKPSSPKNSPVCPVKPTPALDAVPPAPPLPPSKNNTTGGISSPAKRQVTNATKSQQTKIQSDIKRIRVSDPKPGNLYPDLSNIECITTTTTTETETETEYTVEDTEPETATLDEQTESDTVTEAEYYVDNCDESYDSTEESTDIGNTSLGRSILRVVDQQTVSNKKRSIDPDPDSTTSDISVLDEMDEYLDECLALQDANGHEGLEGPTPPKLNRGGKSPSAVSNSFKYSQGSSYRSPIKVVLSAKSPRKGESYVVEGDNCVPLMHSVSFYRRQQSQTSRTPVRTVSRTIEEPQSSTSSTGSNADEEAILVQEKMKQLLEEVCKQQTIIGQASQALNLCSATVEFSGSQEQVEGERLLLLATHRRQAALNEVQRLKVEGTLRPVVPGSPEVQESGSLTVSAITLPLKRDYFRTVDADTCLHHVCLIRHLENIVATPVVMAEPGDSCIRFPSTLKLQDLYSDFKITIEIYSLETRAEVLPHEIKYHIHNNGSNSASGGSGTSNHGMGSKKGGIKTPKKFLKQESRLVMTAVQSPAGPSAVRSPAFSLAGYAVFSLREVQRQHFTLNKVPRSSPLEGRLQMHVSCELSVSVEHRGFLTMFEDVSGFGAWHRRWCLLKGANISYWKYPDDERRKTPIGSIDLQGITTTNVGMVSRDICARPNTFLLESVRPAQPGDVDSLITIRNGPRTTIRHLLSADTKEDRLEWCSKLNKTLNLIRAWGGTSALS
ncbi:anillin isoform X2 [Cephus cinctus]|uniref:Anillin isoform X2 n=1 Tax=Cephus cinctus TaxID=211228 RepID=A0AAJ7FHX1_CEPCN|nr:anillin isoform X2 [Cephus cinctus]